MKVTKIILTIKGLNTLMGEDKKELEYDRNDQRNCSLWVKPGDSEIQRRSPIRNEVSMIGATLNGAPG